MKLAPASDCTACMVCVDTCKHGALSFSIDKNGFFKIDTFFDKCVNCGLCTKVCPVLSPIPNVKDDILKSKLYATWCNDIGLRKMAASGGAFAALAKAVLEQDGIVYGASINGFDVIHKRIDKIVDLPSILGSKYQPSLMVNTYLSIKKDLIDGRTVLFGGLSCQVSGLLNYVGNKLREHLYIVDTICGGISTMLPMLHLKESDMYIGIDSFRNKYNGWKSKGFQYDLRMIACDGGICDLGMNNSVLKCFSSKETKRSSCLDCKFNGFHRISDCTIGDFWGDEQFIDQHKDGLSLIVTHNDRVLQLINQSNLHIEPIGWEQMINFNPNYYWSHIPYYRHSFKRKIVFRYLRANEEVKAINRLEENTIIDRIETKLFYANNENERIEYKNNILSKVK